MAKGLRLHFYGTELTKDEVSAISFALGYNTYPQYHGWGNGGYRNFLGLTRQGLLYETCESLVSKRMMVSEDLPAHYSSSEVLYRVTDNGIKWFRAFKRVHKYPELRK